MSVRDPGVRAQRVVVKTDVVRLGATGHRSLKGWLHDHLDYLERDGTSPDGTPGQLYGRDGIRDTDQFLDRATRDPRHVTIVVSPERGQDLDLTTFTRDLMRQVEQDVGTGLDWAAVNHYDTDHPHSHIVIRGRDLGGEPVFIDRVYLHEGLRYRAQEIATRALGWRWEQEQVHDRAHSPTRARGVERDMEG
jgi:type IV secretory pathway VirD2 relaxase